jgi:hypothetical protein
MGLTIEKLKDKLIEKHEAYFNEYANKETMNQDYFLTLGKCSGIGEVLDWLNEPEL